MSPIATDRQTDLMSEKKQKRAARRVTAPPTRYYRKNEIAYDDIDLSFRVYYDTQTPLTLQLHQHCYVGRLKNVAPSQKCDSELQERIVQQLGYWQIERAKRVTGLRVVVLVTASVTERKLIEIARDELGLTLTNRIAGNRQQRVVDHLYILSFRFAKDDVDYSGLQDYTLPSCVHTRRPDKSISPHFYAFINDFATSRIYISDELVPSEKVGACFGAVPSRDLRVIARKRLMDEILKAYDDGETDRETTLERLARLE